MPELRQRRVALRGLAGLIALVLQNTGDQMPNIGLIIDDQDVVRHARLLLYADPAATCALPESAIFNAATSNGNVISTDAPPPSRSLSESVPPWSSRIFFTIASPSPVPLLRVVT